MTEVWKQVADFEGYYEVSNFGSVRSIDRTVERVDGGGYVKRKGQNMKLHLNHGYKRVTLCMKSELTRIRVHRMVGVAFLCNPENKPQINHKNGIKTDNRVENLEWVTASENCLHAHRVLKIKNGSSGRRNGSSPHARAVLQLTKDGALVKTWDSAIRAQREGGFHKSNIAGCCKGKLKTHSGYIWEYQPTEA